MLLFYTYLYIKCYIVKVYKAFKLSATRWHELAALKSREKQLDLQAMEIMPLASRLLSPVSCLISHVSYLTSPVSCLTSSVSCLLSYLTSPVSLILSHVSCLTSPGSMCNNVKKRGREGNLPLRQKI